MEMKELRIVSNTVVRDLRRNLDVSPDELAEFAGITRNALRRIEGNIHRATVEELGRIVAASSRIAFNARLAASQWMRSAPGSMKW